MRKAKTLTVVANSHYQGQEVVNALQLKAMISGKKGYNSRHLLEKYPQLRGKQHPVVRRPKSVFSIQ